MKPSRHLFQVSLFKAEYDGLFFKYLRKKLSEKAGKICGTLNDDFKDKDKDKKVISHVIKLMNANSTHILGKIKKLGDSKMDAETHKKYHEYVTQLYLSEYIKKSCMVKYTETYGDASAPILDQNFSKDDTIDRVSLEVMGEVKSRLKSFMDEKALKSNLVSPRIETNQERE